MPPLGQGSTQGNGGQGGSTDTLALAYLNGLSATDSTITLDTTRSGLLVDGTGVAVEPLTIKNGNAGSGIRLQATGSARTGYALYDATPTLRGTFGVAISANDWITGTAAGDVVLTGSTSKKIQLGVAGGSAPTVTIDTANGRVGIGMTPVVALDVIGTAARFGLAATNTTGQMQVLASGDTGLASELGVSGSAYNAFTSVAVAANTTWVFGTGTAGHNIISNNASASMGFYVGGTTAAKQAMAIDSSQRVGIAVFSSLANKFTVSGGIEVQGDTFSGSGSGIRGNSTAVKIVVGGNVVGTFTSTGLAGGSTSFDGSATIASGAGATWNGINFTPATATVTGSTNITTATGFNAVNFGTPAVTFTNTITHAATVYIAGAPTISGGGSITNKYALWIDSGTVRIDGAVGTDFGAQATLGLIGGQGATQAAQVGWIPVNCDGNTRYIPIWQ